MEKIKKFLKEEDGVTAIEYTLIAAVIALGIVASVGLVQGWITARPTEGIRIRAQLIVVPCTHKGCAPPPSLSEKFGEGDSAPSCPRYGQSNQGQTRGIYRKTGCSHCSRTEGFSSLIAFLDCQ